MSDKFGPISLSELMFFTNRAAFGAGCAYGVAEDIASIAVWFARQDVDPSSMIAKALDNIADGVSTAQIEKIALEGQIKLRSRSDKPISALYAGIALSDQLATLKGQAGACVVVENADMPDLAALVVKALNQCDSAIEFSASDRALDLDDIAAIPTVAGGDLLARLGVEIKSSDQKRNIAISDHHNILVSQKGWEGIMKHFKKSLVEATEESRNSGAGAGLVDTD